MTDQHVTVTTDGRDVDATVAALEAAGLTVTALHREIGVVSGTVAAADRPALDAVPGVTAVEGDRNLEIAPPDAEVQ